MNKILIVVIIVLITGGVGWLVIYNRNAPKKSSFQDKFQKAPDFTLRDYNGNTIRLADFIGKPLVINSWAAWCPFCRKELTDFALAQKEFGDKVMIIAVDRAESREIAKKYSDELGVTDNLIFLLDPSDSFYRSTGGFSMPETIFVDKDGNVIIHKRGPMNLQEIREKIKQIINI